MSQFVDQKESNEDASVKYISLGAIEELKRQLESGKIIARIKSDFDYPFSHTAFCKDGKLYIFTSYFEKKYSDKKVITEYSGKAYAIIDNNGVKETLKEDEFIEIRKEYEWAYSIREKDEKFSEMSSIKKSIVKIFKSKKTEQSGNGGVESDIKLLFKKLKNYIEEKKKESR